MNRLNITRTDKDDTPVSNKLNKKRKHKVFMNSLKKKQKLTTGEVPAFNEPPLNYYRDYTPHRSNMRRSKSKQTQDDPFANMEHWRNESIYTNPANVHNWSANAHSDYRLNQTYSNSGYHTQQYDQDIQHGGFQGVNNGNTATSWSRENANAYENTAGYSNRREAKPKATKSKKSSRMVVNPFALNLKETQVVNESSSDDEQPLQHISRNRNSKLRRRENEKLIRKGLEKYNQSQNLTWVAENYKKSEIVISNTQIDFQKAFPHFTSWGSSWQDENVEYDRLFLLLNNDFLLETLRTYLYFLQEDGAKVLDFTGLSDETERNFVYFLNGNENQNVKSRLTGESQDLYQEILDLLEAKKDVYHILSGWSTDAKQNRTVIYTKVPVNARNQQPRGNAGLNTGRATRRTQPGRNNLNGIEFVGGNVSKEVGIPDTGEMGETLVSEEMSSANTFKANDPNNTLNENRRGLGKPMNKLLDGLNTPVECSRAERMMHLMGWSGGALGAKGNGITEPIKPNLSMVKGRGLGHEEPSNKNLRTKTPDLQSRSNTPHRSLSRKTRSNNSLTRAEQTDLTNDSMQVAEEKKKKKEERKKRRLESRAQHKELRRKRNEERVLKKLAELAKEKADNAKAEENCAIIIEDNEEKNNKEDKKERKKASLREFKEKERAFKTKGMELILKFLKDHSDEMVCDESLHDSERKCVHMLVQSITSGLPNDHRDNLKQRSLREEIHSHEEARQLFAESKNVNGKRQLHLYKSSLARTRTIETEDVMELKNGRFDTSNDELVRIKILEILAECLENDDIQIIEFSPQLRKFSMYIIRAIVRDVKNGLRITKTYKRVKNIPCTTEEIDVLNRIYDNPHWRLDLSNHIIGESLKRMKPIMKVKRTDNENVSKDTEKTANLSLENVSSDDSNEIIQNIRQKMINKAIKVPQTEPTAANLFVIDTFDSDNESLATKYLTNNDNSTKSEAVFPEDAKLFVTDKFHSDNKLVPPKIDGDSDNDCVCTTKDPELIDIAGDSDSYSENTFSHNQTTYSNHSSDVEICDEIVTPILISSSSDNDSDNATAEKSKLKSIEEYLDMSDSELKFNFKAKGDLNLSESDSDESKDKVLELKSNDCVILSDTESTNAMDCILEAQVEVNIIEGDFSSEIDLNKEVNALDSDNEITQKEENNTDIKLKNAVSCETKIQEVHCVESKEHCSNKNDSESEDNLIIDETVNSEYDEGIDATGKTELKSDEISMLISSNDKPAESTDMSDPLLSSDEINLIQSVLDSEFKRNNFETNAKSDFKDDTLIADLNSEMEAEAMSNISNVESELKSAVATDSNLKSIPELHNQTKEFTNSEMKSQFKCSETTTDTITEQCVDTRNVSPESKSDTQDNVKISTCKLTSSETERSLDFKSDFKTSNEEPLSIDIAVADLNDSLVKKCNF